MTTTSATIKMVGLRQRIALILIPHGLLLVTSVGLFAYLLARFPFDGLTGQDSYAYYYQARELWDGFWGLPVPQWPFVGEGLYHWPVGYHLHLMLGALTLRIDLFIIEAIRGPLQVGFYSVGTRLSDLLALAPNSFFAALLPVMAVQNFGATETGIRGNNRNVEGIVYPYAVRNMAIVGVALSLFGLVFADLIVWICFGPLYAEATGPLRILMLGLLPLLVNRTTTVHLYASHKEHKANMGLALNVGVRALFCAALVPLWGALGAAFGAVVAECAILLFFALTGAMGGTRIGDFARHTARRVSRKALALRYRSFTPGEQTDHSVQVGDMRLQVYRSVFDPKLHFTSDYLARFLLRSDAVKPGSNVLDMGTGSGIAAIAAARAGAGQVVAVDINPAAVRAVEVNARQHGLSERIQAMQGDMFVPVEGQRFDLIITNPPYLRGTADSVAALAYMGGSNLEWFDRFASGAGVHLLPQGSILMVLGDIADTEIIIGRFVEKGWMVSIVAHRELIIEGLTIYRLCRGV